MTAIRALALLAAAGCLGSRPEPAPPAPDPAEVVARFECQRCHDAGPGEAWAPGVLVPEPTDRHCVRCHHDILAGKLDDQYLPEALAAWKANLRHLNAVPTLDALDRFERAWLVDYLQHPRPLRSAHPTEMPRLPLSEAEAQAIATHFGLTDRPPEPPPEGDLQRGAELLASQGCLGCHAFTEALATDPLAPDLRHLRERMRPSVALRWLEDPAAMKPGTSMPRPELDAQGRQDVLAWLYRAPLADPVRPPPPVIPERTQEAVAWPEVRDRVFQKICWHCHSDGSASDGDGGPGHYGGFGYAGADLDLGSLEGILAGSRGPGGARVSMVAPLPDGTPRVVAHMLARHDEVAGKPNALLGMPLGMQPIPPEDIALVWAWIAQGTPP